ncbi:hypothetical protein C7399_12073 [Paraburkholderia tropica]|uniref:Uncharacterized protein n=1 Tax=Paraburkholderia tropica TaxID=92647 RepID=A0ABX5MHG5_9BURK|nr:hypothetical protein [Paraburkholderia tropica]PXX10804.1 hypothetical protein C7400_12073 [Paraburkholderia tropica]PZW75772.1 hypothetical protein C7399_12073 [Paraburkholderia tropica]
MTRYRWLQAEWPLPIRSLAKKIQQQSFADGASNGFIMDRVRENSLEARYIERYEYEETVSDPFGKELTLRRLEFRQTAFRASPNLPGLELVDAPRSVQGLMSQLIEVCNFDLVISPFTVNVMHWAERFEGSFDGPIVIDSIQLGALQVGRGVRAKVVLKGEEDVRSACDKLVSGKKHVLEKLQFRALRDGTGTTVLMANNASVKIDSVGLHDETLAALRASLPHYNID